MRYRPGRGAHAPAHATCGRGPARQVAEIPAPRPGPRIARPTKAAMPAGSATTAHRPHGHCPATRHIAASPRGAWTLRPAQAAVGQAGMQRRHPPMPPAASRQHQTRRATAAQTPHGTVPHRCAAGSRRLLPPVGAAPKRRQRWHGRGSAAGSHQTVARYRPATTREVQHRIARARWRQTLPASTPRPMLGRRAPPICYWSPRLARQHLAAPPMTVQAA